MLAFPVEHARVMSQFNSNSQPTRPPSTRPSNRSYLNFTLSPAFSIRTCHCKAAPPSELFYNDFVSRNLPT